MNGKILAALVISMSASLGGSAGCSSGSEKLTQLPGAERADTTPESFPVLLATVTRQAIVRSVVANGTTEPARVAALGPQMSGRISALYVHEGDKVRAGANLVRLDTDEASLRVQQTAAGAAQSKAQYELAKAEYERLAPLLQRGTITPQQLQRLEAQRDALKSATEAARLANSDAMRMQGNTTIRAPFAGIVSKVPVEVGEIATMVPPTVLLRLVDLSSVDVRVRVHERELARVAIGDQIEAKFPSSNQEALGQVTFISPEIDPRTRNAEVVTRIPNGDSALRAGMFAEISIKPKTSPNSLVIPSSAVAGTGDDRYVFAINEGIAKRQKVRVAPVDSKLVEVLEGVSEGQALVGEGLGRLSDGAHVTPQAALSPDVPADQKVEPTEAAPAPAKKPNSKVQGSKP